VGSDTGGGGGGGGGSKGTLRVSRQNFIQKPPPPISYPQKRMRRPREKGAKRKKLQKEGRLPPSGDSDRVRIILLSKGPRRGRKRQPGGKGLRKGNQVDEEKSAAAALSWGGMTFARPMRLVKHQGGGTYLYVQRMQKGEEGRNRQN